MVKLRLIGMSCSFSVARADRLKSMSSRAAHRQDASTEAIAELFHRFGGPLPSRRPPKRWEAARGQTCGAGARALCPRWRCSQSLAVFDGAELPERVGGMK